jgi:protein TonB
MSPSYPLKADYSRYLYIGLLVAILIHAAAFAFWPEYVPRVYKLSEVVPIFVDVVPEIELPPPPPEIAPPVSPADIIPSDDVGPEETIPQNFVDLQHLPVVPPPPPMEPQVYFGFDVEPRLLQGAKPVYPDLARKAEIEGRVVVLATVDEHGRVINAWVEMSDAEIFNSAALDAAYKFRFEAGEQNGRPVKATVGLTFRFTLRE